MKEFIEKLIGRLGEEGKKWFDIWKKTIDAGDYDNYADGMNDAFCEAIKIARELEEEFAKDINVSTIDAGELLGNGWIPCSERLPIGEEYHKRIDSVDYYKHMLTFANDINAPICVGWYDQEDEQWYDIEGFAYHPKAWMPLPAPYQPKGE